MNLLRSTFLLCLIRSLFPAPDAAGQADGDTCRQIVIEWPDGPVRGSIAVSNGTIATMEFVRGGGRVGAHEFASGAGPDIRLAVSITGARVGSGSDPTIVSVGSTAHPFSFFLRDVNARYPIYVPEFRTAVTLSGDRRSYAQIDSSVKNGHGRTKLQQIEAEGEDSFDAAALRTRNQPCPTWLGLGRDMRIFELSDNRTNPGSEWYLIEPRNGSTPVRIPEFQNSVVRYAYLVGRGQGVAINTARRLEDGVLPILHVTLADEDVEYRSTIFVAPEKSPLAPGKSFGTDWLVADYYSAGHMFTPAQEALVKPRLEEEAGKRESTALYLRCEAVNRGPVPRYAWFKTPRPVGGPWRGSVCMLDGSTGFSAFPSGNVFAISRLNGTPLRDEETAVLIAPGESALFEFVVPHEPLSPERASALARWSFEARHGECRRYWEAKLDRAARITVPEKRINEMIRAGLLQLDLITYGVDPDSTLAPTIGVYPPIGTESSPIIQFYSSVGLADVARRSLMFFLEKQHDDGLIQNFGGYMGETGAALWSMGEYYRYTKDREWVRSVEPRLLRSCDYLLARRRECMDDTLRGKGYGMIAGKVADPNDPYHQYMLNGYAYLGVRRVAEMLADVDSTRSALLAGEAEAWKQDIRSSFAQSIAGSPVVPLGDGRWCPTVPPWTEAAGPRALHIVPGAFFSHGTVTVPDALLGPLHLVFCEVFAPGEPASRMMLDSQSELWYQSNTAFSQPYYSRHDWLELKLGLVKPFLKSYYGAVSALADRETYTFWEHTFQVSPHKTHEQAWFLMETRWMLYLEDGRTLRLLAGIPRKWMEEGKEIALDSVRSYFGPVSLHVRSQVNEGFIEAAVTCDPESGPQDVVIRLPHPGGRTARSVNVGSYDPGTESVAVRGFRGAATIRLQF